MTSLFNKNATFPSLNKVLIEGMDELKMIWRCEFTANSFCKLKDITVRNCKNLMKIIPSSMQRRLQNVTHLEICDCEMVEKVFEIQISNNIEERDPIIPSQLVHLSLKRLLKLKYVWSTDPQGTLSFPNLEKVVASQCPTLESIFPASIAKGVFQLKRLNIHSCGIEVVVAKEEGLGPAPPEFVFPQLVEMELKNLPNLVSFYPGLHTSRWLLLTGLEVINCMKVKVFASEFFQEMHQSAYDENIAMQQPLFLTKRSSVQSLVTPSAFLFVLNLTTLSDTYCPQFETFISNSEDNSCSTIPSLFDQKDCPKFKTFISKLEENSCTTSISSLFNEKFVSFPGLENLELHGCNFTKIWDDQLILSSASFRKLRKLVVYRSMVEIMSSNGSMDKISFPMLHSLALEKLPVLVTVTSAIFSEFPLLTELCIKDCPGFSSFISELDENWSTNANMLSPFKEKAMFPSLEEVLIEGMDKLRMIWHHILAENSFCKLKNITARKCKNLMKIIPSRMQRRLKKVTRLEISDCEMVEEVFEIQMSNDIEETYPIKIPTELTHLGLYHLARLKYVWSKDPQGTLTLPSLREVFASECPNLKSIFPPSIAKGLFRLERLHIGSCGIEEIVSKEEGLGIAQPEFVFPELQEIKLKNLANLVSFYPGLHTSIWKVLTRLDVIDCMKVKVFALEFFQETHGSENHDNVPTQQPLFLTKLSESLKHCRLHNLSKLAISKCDILEEIFEIQMSSNDHQQTSEIPLIHLKELRLGFLPKLKHVWSKDPRGTLTFQDLQVVEAYECQSLKNLFPPSVAKSLLQLRGLYIKKCGIEEIVAKEEGSEAAPYKFVFLQLEVMLLVNLPNLVCFYPGLHTSTCPSLRELDVVGCMKVEVFASELFFSFHEAHESTHHDVPNQLQPLFSVEKVELHTPIMVMISQDQLTTDTFGKLKEIKVCNCKSLTKMFSSSTLRRLHNLRKLVISNCEMLEEVFEIHETPTDIAVSIYLTELKLSFLPKLKHVWSNDPKGTFAFQDLQMLNVHKCQSLKILFPTTVAKNLLQLQELYIGNCGINQIVAKEEGQNQTIIPSFVFPQLNILTLHNLPQLMCFYPGLHTLKWPMLRWVQEPLFLIDKVTYSVGDQEECVGTLSRLSGLKLHDMPNLMHLRDESSQPQTFVQSLTELDILRCGRIKKLVPSSMSFQNLITLKVRQCHGMPSLLTAQTAISMARLENLIIWDCKRMAEIIVDEEGGDDVEGGEIVFARLETLVLDFLPSLTSFYSGKYTLGFPDLENVTVRRCFEMQTFSKHGYMVGTPKLHKLVTESETNKEIDDINVIMAVNTPLDLNTIIPELWKSHPGTVLQQLFCDKGLRKSGSKRRYKAEEYYGQVKLQHIPYLMVAISCLI
ncbi:hypothetical protein FEM48_Zijuj03G0019200 [Ziziphus jujuba var. spinosa]|uniref:Disease resistance protein At4g27190-like leucine-rich repeats domain-containing protein n=1 Tax=Ziziphus jujuba var. spinosa TaxID=714518 RepID=A0A978VMH0_ZIZJJ|nr:hypothetical protein FEM48_Zijuj03G0019200 [Ziziphus jujuba var. spinosa]